MSLRDRLRKLQRAAEGPVVSIPQQDGSVKRFPERDLGPAYVDALDRALGNKGLRHEPEQPEHPICTAARNSSDSRWRDSLYVQERPELITHYQKKDHPFGGCAPPSPS